MSVILVHGMFCGTNCWMPLVQRLLEHGICAHMVELHPNGVQKDGRGFAAVTAAARQQISDVADKQYILVGHSLGALVVERLLPEFPQAIPILVNPSPGWGTLGPIYPLWVAARRGRFWNRTVSLTLQESQRLLFQGMDVDELEEAMQLTEPESGELVRQAFWFFDLFGAATRMPRRAHTNLRVVTGSLDPLGTPAYGARLVRAYNADSKQEVVRGVGHMSILQENCLRFLTTQIVEHYHA